MSGNEGEGDDKQQGAAGPGATTPDGAAAPGAAKGDHGRPEGAEIIAWPGREASASRSEPARSGPDATEALIVKTLASVTGRDPADLLRELRGARGPDEAEDAGKVVDLGAVREARRREEAAASGGLWGPVLKSGMQALFEGFARHAPPSGELVIDAAFMKTHGLSLLGEVLSSVGSSLLGASGAGPASPAPEAQSPAEPSPADTTRPAEGEPVVAAKVEVQMDFGSLASALLAGLLGGRKADSPAPTPPGPSDEPAD